MRADGKIVKNVDPMYTLAPYFMRHRYDAQNMITVNVPYDNIHDYVIDARKKGIKLSHMTVVMAAIVRGFSQFPQLNRFVVNSKIGVYRIAALFSLLNLNCHQILFPSQFVHLNSINIFIN